MKILYILYSTVLYKTSHLKPTTDVIKLPQAQYMPYLGDCDEEGGKYVVNIYVFSVP